MGTDFESLVHATRDVMTGIIELRFDACQVETEAQVHGFFAAVRSAIGAFSAPRDVVICLDNVVVAVEVRTLYGQERAATAKALFRHSARYAGSPVIRIATLTSAIRYQSDAIMYETREEAFAAVLIQRGSDEH